MVLIPQRLFGNSEVTMILRDGNVCILKKELSESLLNREGYISNHVVSVLLSGEQHIRTYEDEVIKLAANEVLFIPRGMYYVSDLLPEEGKFESLLFYFDDDLIHRFLSTSTVTEIDNKSVRSHLKFGIVPSIRLFAESLLGIYQSRRLSDSRLLDLKILELLYLLNDLAQDQQFVDFLFRLTLPKKRNIKAFMENNFDKPLKVEDYAYLTGRSMSTFRRDFKSYYQVTPQRWLIQKRLDRALALLEEKEFSVTELAHEVGYENISYFIKQFKSRTGQSPKQFILSKYRNRIQN